MTTTRNSQCRPTGRQSHRSRSRPVLGDPTTPPTLRRSTILAPLVRSKSHEATHVYAASCKGIDATNTFCVG